MSTFFKKGDWVKVAKPADSAGGSKYFGWAKDMDPFDGRIMRVEEVLNNSAETTRLEGARMKSPPGPWSFHPSWLTLVYSDRPEADSCTGPYAAEVFRVGDEVEVVLEGDPHQGKIGKVNGIWSNAVQLDWDTKRLNSYQYARSLKLISAAPAAPAKFKTGDWVRLTSDPAVSFGCYEASKFNGRVVRVEGVDYVHEDGRQTLRIEGGRPWSFSSEWIVEKLADPLASDVFRIGDEVQRVKDSSSFDGKVGKIVETLVGGHVRTEPKLSSDGILGFACSLKLVRPGDGRVEEKKPFEEPIEARVYKRLEELEGRVRDKLATTNQKLNEIDERCGKKKVEQIVVEHLGTHGLDLVAAKRSLMETIKALDSRVTIMNDSRLADTARLGQSIARLEERLNTVSIEERKKILEEVHISIRDLREYVKNEDASMLHLHEELKKRYEAATENGERRKSEIDDAIRRLSRQLDDLRMDLAELRHDSEKAVKERAEWQDTENARLHSEIEAAHKRIFSSNIENAEWSSKLAFVFFVVATVVTMSFACYHGYMIENLKKAVAEKKESF